MGILQKIARPVGTQISASPDIFRIDASPGAGLACFAAKGLSRSEVVLTVQQPVAGVVINRFKKEVCAWCYSYNFGSIHKFKVEIAKGRGVAWFCQISCKDSWTDNVGEMGWEAIRAFEEGLGRKGTQSTMCTDPDTPCNVEQIESLWQAASEEGGRILAQRLARPRFVPKTAMLPADVDIDDARFILSACITFSMSEEATHEVLNLAPTLTLYTKSMNTVRSHISIYHYILSVLPVTSPVLSFVSPANILSVMTRDTGNSWGIWDKSLAGEELLAYCLYPPASFFNHSCAPNISKERIGRAYEFRTCDNLAFGSELSVSYLGKAESEMNWQRRQEKLLVSPIYSVCYVWLSHCLSRMAGVLYAPARGVWQRRRINIFNKLKTEYTSDT